MSTKQDIKIKNKINLADPPKKFQFLFFNDDYTPLDFVVYLFVNFFDLNQTNALKKAEEIHQNEQGLIEKSYGLSIAQTKANEIKQLIDHNKLVLKFKIVPEKENK